MIQKDICKKSKASRDRLIILTYNEIKSNFLKNDVKINSKLAKDFNQNDFSISIKNEDYFSFSKNSCDKITEKSYKISRKNTENSFDKYQENSFLLEKEISIIQNENNKITFAPIAQIKNFKESISSNKNELSYIAFKKLKKTVTSLKNVRSYDYRQTSLNLPTKKLEEEEIVSNFKSYRSNGDIYKERVQSRSLKFTSSKQIKEPLVNLNEMLNEKFIQELEKQLIKQNEEKYQPKEDSSTKSISPEISYVKRHNNSIVSKSGKSKKIKDYFEGYDKKLDFGNKENEKEEIIENKLNFKISLKKFS